MNLNDKIDKIEETIIGSDYFEGKLSCNKDSEWGVVRYLSKGEDRIYE